MSGRRSAMSSTSKSPEEYKFEWDSDNANFRFYSTKNPKDANGNYDIKSKDLPFNFIVIDRLYQVGGFDNDKNKGIYSEEFKSFDQEITVRYNKGGEIASGKWVDVRDSVKACGAKLHLVLFALLSNGQLAKISLKGKAYVAAQDYIEGAGDALYDNFASISSYTQEKNGRNEYTVPVFTLGDPVSVALGEVADDKYDLEVRPYVESKSSNVSSEMTDNPDPKPVEAAAQGVAPAVGEPNEAIEDDDIPF